MHNLQCSPLRRPNGPQGIRLLALVSVYSSINQPLPRKYVQYTILGTRNKTEKVLALKDIIFYWFLWGEVGENADNIQEISEYQLTNISKHVST